MVLASSIKTRILSILGLLVVGYLLLLTVVQMTAAATHRHLEHVSSTLFPAALRLREAEASFEQLRKSYKDAVLFEDPAALAAADKDGEAVAEALAALCSQLEGFVRVRARGTGAPGALFKYPFSFS